MRNITTEGDEERERERRRRIREERYRKGKDKLFEKNGESRKYIPNLLKSKPNYIWK